MHMHVHACIPDRFIKFAANSSTYTSTEPSRRKRSRASFISRKCLSCRKLKIKVRVCRCNPCSTLTLRCDEALPTCEYCVHTNRNCVYPVPEVVSSLLAALNSTTNQMQITRFELRLLSFFHNIYLKQHSNDDPAQQRVWTIEVPILWQHSDLVRQSIFLLSAMILWNFCDLDELYRADTDLLPWSGKSDFSPRDASTSSSSALSLLSVVQDFRCLSLEYGIDAEDVGHLRCDRYSSQS